MLRIIILIPAFLIKKIMGLGGKMMYFMLGEREYILGNS